MRFLSLEFLCVLLAAVAALSLFLTFFLIRRVKRQLNEMKEALADVRSGNGNRRILAQEHELTAQIVYEINDIIISYEERLAAFRETEETNKQLMTSLSHDEIGRASCRERV